VVIVLSSKSMLEWVSHLNYSIPPSDDGACIGVCVCVCVLLVCASASVCGLCEEFAANRSEIKIFKAKLLANSKFHSHLAS
jgi:hypothetical protein